MNTTIYRYLFAAVFATLALAACSDIGRTKPDNGPVELLVAVQLSGARTETRADGDGTDNGYDNWSYRGFSLGDQLGFFSPHGDWEKRQDGKDDAFVNLCLEYQYNDELKNNYFGNPDIQFSATFIDDPSKCFVYMPYAGERDKAEFELRRSGEGKFDDDILRCVDYLQTQNNLQISGSGNSATLTGTMAHSFSELIIMRGTGFDDPPEDRKTITVVLTDGFSHMEITVPTEEERKAGKWFCTPTLIYKEGYAIDGRPMNKDACREWVAWQGSDFKRTDLNNIGVPAWYVILPTLADHRSTVAYIKLYDNEGQEQRVTAIKLQHHADNGAPLGVDKQLYPGWRYPVEIRMDELVPTINPYPILSWNSGSDGKDTDITNERKRGITSQHDFDLWLQLYNQYIGGADNKEQLLQYGDLIHYEESDTESGRDEWHFYLLSDIDLADYEYNDSEKGPLIPSLKDILDGRSTTRDGREFENYTLKNLKTPFVGTLEAYGQLLNMDFEEPDIIRTTYVTPAGTLANKVDGGKIDNCNITDGTLFTSGPVGMIAGEVVGGTVSNCSASGFMVGSESYVPHLFGKAPAEGSVIDGNTSKVLFSPTGSGN